MMDTGQSFTPNASLPVWSCGMKAFVALHRMANGDVWVARFNEPTGRWVTLRKATDDDLRVLKAYQIPAGGGE